MTDTQDSGSVNGSASVETAADQAVEDLCQLAITPVEQLNVVASAVEGEAGFLYGDRLWDLVSQIVSDERQARSISRILENFQPESTSTILEYLRNWRLENQANAERLSQSAYDDIAAKLPQLLRPYPAIKRHVKARVLSSAIGNVAQSIHLFCDLRPVFDENQERVEGYVPLTILRLSYKEQSGQMREVEVHLTKTGLDIIRRETEKAQKKLDVLQRSVENCLPPDLF